MIDVANLVGWSRNSLGSNIGDLCWGGVDDWFAGYDIVGIVGDGESNISGLGTGLGVCQFHCIVDVCVCLCYAKHSSLV